MASLIQRLNEIDRLYGLVRAGHTPWLDAQEMIAQRGAYEIEPYGFMLDGFKFTPMVPGVSLLR